MAEKSKRYTNDEIDAIMIVLQSNDGNVIRTARELGLHRNTVVRLAKKREQVSTATHQDKREGRNEHIIHSLSVSPKAIDRAGDIAAQYDVLAAKAVRQAIEMLPSASSRDAGVVAGIATDKGRLIRGEATQIIEGRCLLVDGMLSRLTPAQLAQYAILTAIMEGSAPSSVGLPPPDEDIIEGEVAG